MGPNLQPKLRLFLKDVILLTIWIAFLLKFLTTIFATRSGFLQALKIIVLLCAPLGGQCSNVLSCCGPAECVGDNGDTSCLPSTDTPNTSSPTKAPSSAPSSSCIHCDNVATNYMIENGKDCTAVNLGNKCIKKNSWISNKFCQLSCYDFGLGYEGDVCCNGEAVN